MQNHCTLRHQHIGGAVLVAIGLKISWVWDDCATGSTRLTGRRINRAACTRSELTAFGEVARDWRSNYLGAIWQCR